MWYAYGTYYRAETFNKRQELNLYIDKYGFKYIKEFLIIDEDDKCDNNLLFIMLKSKIDIDKEQLWKIHLKFSKYFDLGISRWESLDSHVNNKKKIKKEEELCI